MIPDERAWRSAEAMWAGDAAARWLGLVLDTVGPVRTVMSMTVAANHLNGHEICHDGVIDTAFAYACNSYNQPVVAQHDTLSYLSPGHKDERLMAIATEVSHNGRSGIYDVVETG